MHANRLTPILNVSNIQESFAWFEKLGWEKGWDWGSPPTFGGVCSGNCEMTGEFLVNASGSVVRVWTVREISFDPPFPPFNQAIVDEIEGWKFEPVLVHGEPVPACATVTISIDWS